jgi:hypothetical protein
MPAVGDRLIVNTGPTLNDSGERLKARGKVVTLRVCGVGRGPLDFIAALVDDDPNEERLVWPDISPGVVPNP